MLLRIPLLILLAVPLMAQDRAWKSSAAVMLVSSAADYASSVGKPELSPMLRRADGRFSPARGAALKVGLPVALVAGQAKAPKRYRKLWTVVNFALAAEFSYAAIHNARNK